MGLLSGLFTTGASGLVDAIGTTLSKVVTTTGQKMQLDNEIKKADMDYQVEMAKLSNDERAAILQDVQSARTMQSQIDTSANATKLDKNTPPFLAIGATFLCFTLFFILVFGTNIGIDITKAKEIILYILGVLSALLTQIYSFYFGSSAGSQEKDKTIANQLQ